MKVKDKSAIPLALLENDLLILKSDLRGHPRMRARHMPFPIGTAEKDAWMRNMKAALNTVPEFAEHKDTLTEFFETFATFLINKPE